MTRGKRLAVVGAIVGLLMVVSAVAYAVLDATVTNGVNNIRLKSQTTPSTTQSTDWVALPDASFDMAVPNNQMKTFIAEFSAESYCDGPGPSPSIEYCGVRILMDGVEMTPAAGTNMAFDSDGEGNDGWESHSMIRYAADVAPGLHTFSVEYRVTSGDVAFRLDDWVFMVTKASQK